jgi:hypothetical protein
MRHRRACNTDMPFADFNKRSSATDGYSNLCNQCHTFADDE